MAKKAPKRKATKKSPKKAVKKKACKRGGISHADTAVRGAKAIQAERAKKAFELRKAHLTYDEIADALGFSRTTVYKDIAGVIADLQAETRETADAARRIELESLDEIERTARLQSRDAHRVAYETFYARKEDGTFEPIQVLSKEKAIRLCRVATQSRLDCKRRRAKLLGLDAPTKHLIEISNVQRILTNHNALIGRLVEKFVPRDLRPQLATEFHKILESSCRSMKPVEIERN